LNVESWIEPSRTTRRWDEHEDEDTEAKKGKEAAAKASETIESAWAIARGWLT
jgi:hypothetical protein